MPDLSARRGWARIGGAHRALTGAGGEDAEQVGHGVDLFLNTYNLLDMTPLGGNETRPMQWLRYRDRYGT